MYPQPTYYPIPSSQTPQQRLQMMEAQYPQFSQNPYTGYSYQPQNQVQSGSTTVLKGRPVSNEEEANAAMIDFDGSLFVFPDKAHGKIYTKQLGLDGNIVFLKYSLDTDPLNKPSEQVQTSPEYIKKEDFDRQISSFQKRLNQLEDQFKSSSSKGRDSK